MLHSTQHTAPGLDSQLRTLFPSGRRRGSRRAAAATSPTRADLPRPRRWRGQACTAAPFAPILGRAVLAEVFVWVGWCYTDTSWTFSSCGSCAVGPSAEWRLKPCVLGVGLPAEDIAVLQMPQSRAVGRAAGQRLRPFVLGVRLSAEDTALWNAPSYLPNPTAGFKVSYGFASQCVQMSIGARGERV